MIPPNAGRRIQLTVAAVNRGEVPSGAGLLEGGTRFQNSTDLHPWLNAIVEVDQEGNTWGEVLNTTDEQIKVEQGQVYGTFTKTRESKDGYCHPWRVHVVSLPRRVKLPKAAEDNKTAPSLREKREFIEKEFQIDKCDCLKTGADKKRAVDLLVKY